MSSGKDKINVTFADILSKLLSERGLSAAALAKKLGVSHVAVGNYLRGKAFPRSRVLLRLAEVFQVPPSSFMPPGHWVRLDVAVDDLCDAEFDQLWRDLRERLMKYDPINRVLLLEELHNLISVREYANKLRAEQAAAKERREKGRKD
jgi:transcriptional regulator with XRE-family HTH domain